MDETNINGVPTFSMPNMTRLQKLILLRFLFPALLGLLFIVLAVFVVCCFVRLFRWVHERFLLGGVVNHPPLTRSSRPRAPNLSRNGEAPAEVRINIPAPENYRSKQDDSVTSCAICLEDLEEGALCVVLPGCQHTFHAPCIIPWILISKNCPICRQSLLQRS